MKRTEKNRVEKLPDTDYTKKRSQLKMIMFRYSKNKLAVLGLIILIILSLCAIFADVIADYDTMAIEQHIMEKLQPPSKEHWFGTDHYGRDVFARIVHGARISLSMGIGTVFVSLAVGSLFGALAGYYGGKVDNIIMRVMDVFLAIPNILMAVTIVGALGGGLVNLLIALSISSVPKFTRIIRSSILTVRDMDYIEAAKACGTKDRRIILKHVIPNAIGPIIVNATLSLANVILSISGMSFIGLGIEKPMPEWGSMLAEAKAQMRYYPSLVIIPGICIALAVFGLNLVGDGLRDALDPKLKN
jgi:peptide/nickel transport system permease protein